MTPSQTPPPSQCVRGPSNPWKIGPWGLAWVSAAWTLVRGAAGAGSGAWRSCGSGGGSGDAGSKRAQTPETAGVASSGLLSNPGRRVGAAGRPRSPRRSRAAAPPPRPSPPPAGCCARLLAGRSGARGARAAAAASRTSPRPARSLVRPWPARSSSGRGGGTKSTRTRRRRRPCRTRSWPWLASTCCSTTASGSRISFSNNTGDTALPTLCPGCAHRVVTSRPAAALFPASIRFPRLYLQPLPYALAPSSSPPHPPLRCSFPPRHRIPCSLSALLGVPSVSLLLLSGGSPTLGGLGN